MNRKNIRIYTVFILYERRVRRIHVSIKMYYHYAIQYRVTRPHKGKVSFFRLTTLGKNPWKIALNAIFKKYIFTKTPNNPFSDKYTLPPLPR